MVAVKWCEAEVRTFEWTNTFSNLIFAITAYVGWRLAKERGLPFEFVAAELLLIVVFVGSVLFHGTAGASWRAELLDELPMMLLAHAYLWSVRDIHPWTRPPLWGRTLFVGAGVPIVGAVTYVWWQNYAVFINTLTYVAGVSSMAWGQTHNYSSHTGSSISSRAASRSRLVERSARRCGLGFGLSAPSRSEKSSGRSSSTGTEKARVPRVPSTRSTGSELCGNQPVSLHAIEPTRPRGQRRVDGVGRPKFDSTRVATSSGSNGTGSSQSPYNWPPRNTQG